MIKTISNIIKSPKINNISDNDDNLNILQLISKYQELYTNTKKSENLSKYSIRNIITALERFYHYIADEFDNDDNLSINEINRYFINNYLTILEKQGLSHSSQKLYITIIKNFITFIADNDKEKYKNLKTNILGIKIKTKQKEKIGFSQNDQKLLLSLFDKLDNKKTYTVHRKSLMLKILYFAGVRASELASIKWSDIVEQNDEQHGLLYVILIKGKGNKERLAYLQYDIISKNYDFIKQRNTDSVYVFETAHGNIPNTANMYIEVKNELQKAGIKQFGLHIFRHTFARNLVSKDVNLATIKDLLGHSNITVTAQFYAKSDEKAKRNALFKTKEKI